MIRHVFATCFLAFLVFNGSFGEEPTATLPATQPLTPAPDMSLTMREGLDRFAWRLVEKSVSARQARWRRDFSSLESYSSSVERNRRRLREILGIIDQRLPIVALELMASTSSPAFVAEAESYEVFRVRWPVFEGVHGEGLLLQPKSKPRARVIAITDADQTPERLAGLSELPPEAIPFARRLVEQGIQVVVPLLIDRDDTWSGDPDIWMTNQPHREWIYRPAFELGRHIIGYEVQKVLSVVDWFVHENQESKVPIGVAGYGEGGLLAFYAAAVDPRIDSTWVSGYFDSRQGLFKEPIYRNVFDFLSEFGDAEIATLIVPRNLVIEYSRAPKVDGPPTSRPDHRPYAAPGAIVTPTWQVVEEEFARGKQLLENRGELTDKLHLVAGPKNTVLPSGSDESLGPFVRSLTGDEKLSGAMKVNRKENLVDVETRRRRQVKELVDHTQSLIALSQKERERYWSKAAPASLNEWQAACREYRKNFHEQIIGRMPEPSEPMNPKSRRIQDRVTWTAHEVTLDVWPEVFCWGILLVPKWIAAEEKRPVVVCQHGAEGLPHDVMNEDPKSEAFATYKAYAVQLVERGYVVYAPHNFYRGGNQFRQIHRKLNPLGKTIFAVIVEQHRRHLEWLSSLPFVDPKRIAFYGLSYGGYTAERVPPLLDGYALAISSAEFNDMVRKKASVRDKYSFPFYFMYEYFEFNMANRYSYGDLIGMMAPRPFMVERGHDDGVAPDEWVASEYAKIRRLYDRLGISENTAIEFFNGPHCINGKGTFEFLERHLQWPRR
ncbi:MAG: dienelactone hydrolase family protein [Planctomycetota bacterium]